MTKRESKGQQVKSFKYFEPQEDATYVEQIAKVYFVPTHNWFAIYLPEHMHKVVETLPIFVQQQWEARGVQLSHTGDHICGKVVDQVIEAFKAILHQYFEHLTDLTAVKVIEVFYKANLPWDRDRYARGEPTVFRGGEATARDDISFCGQPAVHLNYRVVWRSGDKLYRKVDHEAYKDRPAYHTMQYIADPFLHMKDAAGRKKIENRILPWTQEKEDFFRGAVAKLTELGFLLHDFFGDTETNLTYALTQGGGQLVLAPPSPEHSA